METASCSFRKCPSKWNASTPSFVSFHLPLSDVRPYFYPHSLLRSFVHFPQPYVASYWSHTDISMEVVCRIGTIGDALAANNVPRTYKSIASVIERPDFFISIFLGHGLTFEYQSCLKTGWLIDWFWCSFAPLKVATRSWELPLPTGFQGEKTKRENECVQINIIH